jgi:hypothetical protein
MLPKWDKLSQSCKLTFDPRWNGLETVHHGRVKARCPLDAESARHQDEVEGSQVGLLIPLLGILARNVGDPRVSQLFLVAYDCHNVTTNTGPVVSLYVKTKKTLSSSKSHLGRLLDEGSLTRLAAGREA